MKKKNILTGFPEYDEYYKEHSDLIPEFLHNHRHCLSKKTVRDAIEKVFEMEADHKEHLLKELGLDSSPTNNFCEPCWKKGQKQKTCKECYPEQKGGEEWKKKEDSLKGILVRMKLDLF